MAPEEIALVVNPTAGKGRGDRAGAAAAGVLAAAGITVREIRGRDAAEAAAALAAAVAAGVGAVVAVGGDGMVHLALQAVAGTGVPLGIVAAGTGNDIARELGLPTGDPRAAAAVVVAGESRRIDAARAAGRWYAAVLAAGFDSRVNDRANRMSWPHGRLRYDLAILAELRVFRPLPFELTLDGQRWDTEAMLVAVGNIGCYGGGMRVCPDARADDGLLDVTVVGPLSKAQFVRIFPKVYRGTHVEHPRVTTRQAATVGLAAPGVTAYADGELLAALPLTCEAVPGAVRVFVPAGT